MSKHVDAEENYNRYSNILSKQLLTIAFISQYVLIEIFNKGVLEAAICHLLHPSTDDYEKSATMYRASFSVPVQLDGNIISTGLRMGEVQMC